MMMSPIRRQERGDTLAKMTWADIRHSLNMTQAEMAKELDMSVQLYQLKETYKRGMKLSEAAKILEMADLELRDVRTEL